MSFKDYYDLRAMRVLADHILPTWPGFPVQDFLRGAEALEALSLKQRVTFIAQALRRCLPQDFRQAAALLHQVMERIPIIETEADQQDDGWSIEQGEATLQGFSVWPLTRLVSQAGLEDFDTSMGLLQAMTARFTAEFDIRPFLLQDQARVLALLHDWSTHPNHHVRRLCSEGTRPRLPWAEALPGLRDQPAPALALLEKLKDDPSLYVRRSVANHLNDISVHHPELVLSTLARWLEEPGGSPERRWIANHASRTLYKQGHPDALRLMGFDPDASVTMTALEILDKEVKHGDPLVFTLTLACTASKPVQVMFDYAIHYQKARGDLRPKVFKGGRLTLEPGQRLTLTRRRATADTSVRKHHLGPHRLEVFLNGVSQGVYDWTLR